MVGQTQSPIAAENTLLATEAACLSARFIFCILPVCESHYERTMRFTFNGLGPRYRIRIAFQRNAKFTGHGIKIVDILSRTRSTELLRLEMRPECAGQPVPCP